MLEGAGMLPVPLKLIASRSHLWNAPGKVQDKLHVYSWIERCYPDDVLTQAQVPRPRKLTEFDCIISKKRYEQASEPSS